MGFLRYTENHLLWLWKGEVCLNAFYHFYCREEIETAVKTIIKNTVSDAVEIPDQEKHETLASKMRLLSFNEWIDLLNQLFDNLIVLLRYVLKCIKIRFQGENGSSMCSIRSNPVVVVCGWHLEVINLRMDVFLVTILCVVFLSKYEFFYLAKLNARLNFRLHWFTYFLH